MKKSILTWTLLLALSAPIYAYQGDEYMDFTINGKTIHSLIPNKDTRQDFILLQKALHGDTISREALIGGKPHKWLFIGDGLKPIWVKLSKDGEELVEY